MSSEDETINRINSYTLLCYDVLLFKISPRLVKSFAVAGLRRDGLFLSETESAKN